LTIIIADDQKHARSGLKAALAASLPGLEMKEATTGLEAERLADEILPDLILMDIRMPDKDGLSATRQIKARHPEIRIIIHSLHGESSQEALAAGADAFVSKGEGFQRLLETIAALAIPHERP